MFYEWLYRAKRDKTIVHEWLKTFERCNKDFYTLAGCHPGYMASLNRNEWYKDTDHCWITTWCNENVTPHPSGAPAFAVILVDLVDLYVKSESPTGHGWIGRVLFDRESDAALFKLTFSELLTNIRKLENT